MDKTVAQRDSPCRVKPHRPPRPLCHPLENIEKLSGRARRLRPCSPYRRCFILDKEHREVAAGRENGAWLAVRVFNLPMRITGGLRGAKRHVNVRMMKNPWSHHVKQQRGDGSFQPVSSGLRLCREGSDPSINGHATPNCHILCHGDRHIPRRTACIRPDDIAMEYDGWSIATIKKARTVYRLRRPHEDRLVQGGPYRAARIEAEKSGRR